MNGTKELIAGQPGSKKATLSESENSVSGHVLPRQGQSFLSRHKEIINILLLGVGFMFSMGSYSTCAMAQTVILNDIQDEYFNGTSTIGYSVLCVVYASTAVSFLIAPSVSAVIGPKIAMVSGAVFLLLYVVTFIRPLTVTLYLGAVSQGLGQGLIWTVYGFLLSTNSTEKTIGRNTGIFWCLLQSSLVSGNLFYSFMLHGTQTLSESSRVILFVVLTISATLGITTLSFLRHPWVTRRPRATSLVLFSSGKSSLKSSHHGPVQALLAMLKLQCSRRMLLLLPTFIYVGLDLSWFMNVYGTSIGYTMRFGAVREALVGLNGIFVGVGQIIGGLLFACLGKCAQKRGRDPGIIVGMLSHFLTYFLVFINIPGNASLGVTNDPPYYGPSPYIAMICSVLLGFGDAAWINQICALLGILFKDDCVSAFALFQFVQCGMASAAFFYSAYLTIPCHLLINVTFAILGAAGFCLVEWEAASDERRKVKPSKIALAEEQNLLAKPATEIPLPIYTKLGVPTLTSYRPRSEFEVIPSTMSDFS